MQVHHNHISQHSISSASEKSPHMPPTTYAYPLSKQRLDSCLVCDRRNALWLVVLRAHSSCLPWLGWLSLQVDVLAGLLGLALLGCVGLDTGKELVARSRVADVLDADVDALLDVAVADLSVEDDADCGLGDVVDDTGLSVVDLVWLWVVLVAVSYNQEEHVAQSIDWMSHMLFRNPRTMPFWTAPLATTSTMSPTLYCLRYVPRAIMPFFLKSREKAVIPCQHVPTHAHSFQLSLHILLPHLCILQGGVVLP